MRRSTLSGTSPGILAVTGDLTQGVGAVLDVELGGTAVGTRFDQVAFTGIIAVTGTLNVVLIDGFMPAEGSTFAVVSAGSRTGTFDTVTGLALELEVQNGATTVTLVMVAVPD